MRGRRVSWALFAQSTRVAIVAITLSGCISSCPISPGEPCDPTDDTCGAQQQGYYCSIAAFCTKPCTRNLDCNLNCATPNLCGPAFCSRDGCSPMLSWGPAPVLACVRGACRLMCGTDECSGGPQPYEPRSE